MESLADKLAGGSLDPLITHLMQEKKIFRAEIKRLRQILDEKPGPATPWSCPP